MEEMEEKFKIISMCKLKQLKMKTNLKKLHVQKIF
jgi:hypothetical protein